MSSEAHQHCHGHGHDDKGLRWGFVLIAGFAFVELFGGLWADSLALLSDASHMFSDAIALGLAALASRAAKRPPSARHSCGLARTEVLAALFNSALMLIIIVSIAWHAIERMLSPSQVVDGGAVSVIAFIGLLINILVAWLLHGGIQTLNTRAAMLHVLSDLLGSVAALAAGLTIYLTGWMMIDPILSLFICLLILASSLRLLNEVLQVILEGVPADIDLPAVGHSLAAIDGVDSVHDLHIWTLSSGRPVLTAHIVVTTHAEWAALLPQLRQHLQANYNIDHITLQPETRQQIAQESPLVWHQQATPPAS